MRSGLSRLATAAFVLTALVGGAGSARAADEGRAIGSPDAPVTVIEYLSVTCPHCAKWQDDVFPAFKARYIDTGQVRYVLREVNLHGAPDVAGFLLARCVDDSRYFDVVFDLMKPSARPDFDIDAVKGDSYRLAGRRYGLTDEQVTACLTDSKSLKAMNRRMSKEAEEFDLQAAPTFVVNGRKLDLIHPPSLDELAEVIDPLLARK